MYILRDTDIIYRSETDTNNEKDTEDEKMIISNKMAHKRHVVFFILYITRQKMLRHSSIGT